MWLSGLHNPVVRRMKKEGVSSMQLVQITEHVYYYTFNSDLDRPCLGYIKGDDYPIAVDAGHSSRHVNEFYQALEEKDCHCRKSQSLLTGTGTIPLECIRFMGYLWRVIRQTGD